MTVEEFELKQSKMSDSELINLCQKEVGELASTYGKSHKMTIPPSIKDTDMLLSELIKRFKMLSEAARWRDPKEECPGKSLPVVVKYEVSDGHVKYWVEEYSYERFVHDADDIGAKIIGWRPI